MTPEQEIRVKAMELAIIHTHNLADIAVKQIGDYESDLYDMAQCFEAFIASGRIS